MYNKNILNIIIVMQLFASAVTNCCKLTDSKTVMDF